MSRLHLTLLGGFQARLQTGEVMSLPGRKAQALLAFLALPLGRAHPRDKLAALPPRAGHRVPPWGMSERARAEVAAALVEYRAMEMPYRVMSAEATLAAMA